LASSPITSQRALNYPVGDHYSYTNSGYLLARTLVERVSGQDFETFTAERIFKPLGLTHTSWRGNFTRVVPGLAQAYRRHRGEWQLDMPNDHVIAAGGLWTTVGDWLARNEHLTTRTLGAAVVVSGWANVGARAPLRALYCDTTGAPLTTARAYDSASEAVFDVPSLTLRSIGLSENSAPLAR
jgi:CubicO group peptidase (beta-lactamase class C family)